MQWRNAAYAVQWWIFALFALWMWARMVRDETRRERAARAPPATAAEPGDRSPSRRVTMVRVTTPEPSTLAAPTPATPSTPWSGGLRIEDADGVRPRLTFFKVMAFIVGIGLLVLVAEMVLSYGFDMKGDENPLHWWPQPHGFIYMVYLVATALLGFKVGWSLTEDGPRHARRLRALPVLLGRATGRPAGRGRPRCGAPVTLAA